MNHSRMLTTRRKKQKAKKDQALVAKRSKKAGKRRGDAVASAQPANAPQ